jgi:bacillithiol system protein YtxJ
MPAKIIKIDTVDKLDSLFEESNRRPVFLFKHSNSCGISADLMYQVSDVDADLHLVVVQQSRPISQLIAERTGHRHQSPQAFVLKNGVAVYHATHYGIDPDKITKFLDSKS